MLVLGKNLEKSVKEVKTYRLNCWKIVDSAMVMLWTPNDFRYSARCFDDVWTNISFKEMEHELSLFTLRAYFLVGNNIRSSIEHKRFSVSFVHGENAKCLVNVKIVCG